MTESKATQEETYKHALIDDIIAPLSLLHDFMRTVELSDRHEYSWPYLEAEFGKIQVKHEKDDADKQIYSWGKIVGVIVKKGGEV